MTAWIIQTVHPGDTASLEAVRALWTAYWAAMNLPAEFQSFSEELRGLPGKYVPPAGRLFLVRDAAATPIATAAFRALDATVCEAKRLWVAPAARHQGIAEALVVRLMEEARAAGYRTICGDTLPQMSAALALYRKLGFTETGPYSETPTPGAIYLRRDL